MTLLCYHKHGPEHSHSVYLYTTDQRITASVFKAMNTEIINQLNLTIGGRIKVEQLLNELESQGTIIHII